MIIILKLLKGAFISIFSNQLKMPQAESFKACCQWALLNVQRITLLLTFNVQKYIYPPVSKDHAGSFCVSVIHRTLTRTTGSLTCMQDHSYACMYIYTGVGRTLTASQHIFYLEKHSQMFLVFLTEFEPWVFRSQV